MLKNTTQNGTAAHEATCQEDECPGCEGYLMGADAWDGDRPRVGAGCTYTIGSDRYAGRVLKVSESGTKVWYTTTGSRDLDRASIATRRQGRDSEERPIYRAKGAGKYSRLHIGVRRRHMDPHF